MKKNKLITTVISATVLLISCSSNNTSGIEKNTMSGEEPKAVEIIGKTGTVTFPQFSVEETFVSDSVLHWKIKYDKDSIVESEEKISYKKLNDNLFFINWIEKTGLTVSQVLDAKNGTATAFVSRHDEKSERGQRSANFFQGTFEVK